MFTLHLGIAVTSLGSGKMKLQSTLFDLEPLGVGCYALTGRLKGIYLKLQDHPNSFSRSSGLCLGERSVKWHRLRPLQLHADKLLFSLLLMYLDWCYGHRKTWGKQVECI